MATTADQAVYAVLSVHAGLTALVFDRIYPVEAPQGADQPMLVYQSVSNVSEATHDEGPAARLDGCRYQLTALAQSPLAAQQIIYQARLALENSNLGSIMLDERDLPRAEQANCFGRCADFQVWNDPDA